MGDFLVWVADIAAAALPSRSSRDSEDEYRLALGCALVVIAIAAFAYIIVRGVG